MKVTLHKPAPCGPDMLLLELTGGESLFIFVFVFFQLFPLLFFIAMELFEAALKGQPELVREVLQRPGLNVNWENTTDSNKTAFHLVAATGSQDLIKSFLYHPDIDVNRRTTFRNVPFLLARFNGNPGVMKVLLEDPRIDIVAQDQGGRTPLWWASSDGLVNVVRWMIASGRELALEVRGKTMGDGKDLTPAEVAKKNKKDKGSAFPRLHHSSSSSRA